jgi:hypothetical protein
VAELQVRHADDILKTSAARMSILASSSGASPPESPFSAASTAAVTNSLACENNGCRRFQKRSAVLPIELLSRALMVSQIALWHYHRADGWCGGAKLANHPA